MVGKLQVNWRVSIWIGSKVYFDNYQNMPQNTVISTRVCGTVGVSKQCVLDPDFIESNGGTGGEKGGDENPLINAVFSLSAILMAALTRIIDAVISEC